MDPQVSNVRRRSGLNRGPSQVREDLDIATQVAVTGLRAFGYSWGEIASRLGTTRQAAQQRWGR